MSLKGQVCYGLYIVMHLIMRITVPIAILSTSQNSNAPVSFAPACALCLLFCIIQVLAVYLYKFFTIPEFRKESLEHQIVHVLANTIVVIPYSNWDQDEPPNLVLSVKQIKMNRRIKRKHFKPASSSLKTHIRNRSHDFAQNFKKGHNRSKSDGAHKFPIVHEPQKPSIADAILPNFAELESKQNIQKELMKIWWDNPAERLTADNAKEALVGYKMGKINVEDIEEVVRTLNEKGLINKKLFNPRRTKKEYFWLLIIQILLNLAAFGIEVANAGADVAYGNYYSWDVRLATFVMGMIFLSMYYKKYHVMRKLIKFRYCGWGLNYCPIFFGAKKDQPMKAIPNEVKLERILSEEELVKSTKETRDFKSQTSFTSVKIEHEAMTAVEINIDTNNDAFVIQKEKLVVNKSTTKGVEFSTQTSILSSNNVNGETETAV